MKRTYLIFFGIFFLSITNLFSQQEEIDSLEIENFESDEDSSIVEENSSEVIGYLLETARNYYLEAISVKTHEDSLKSVEKFEKAIEVLNYLSSMPSIEQNEEYNNLVKNIVEDYEKYIANIDALGSSSSIFALRKKLNQSIDKEKKIEFESAIPKDNFNTEIPLIINNYVENNIYFLKEKSPQHFRFWMSQSGRYFSVIEKILREEGVPDELKYLAMIESGLTPKARSWAKAVGMWQFMKSTGSSYGLKFNYWTDDRCDVEKSTRAAAKHLRDLYNMFNDWHLALAAYNSGAGRVSRAIKKSGTTNFWKMWNYLPRETRNYVPSFIAATLMAKSPEQYGFYDLQYNDPLIYDEVEMNESVDLSVLANCAMTTVDSIKTLNPSLLRFATPNTNFTLRIPVGSKEMFLENYSKIPESEKHQWITHKVKRGETLKKIASCYGITTSDLATANNLLVKSKVRSGKILHIPISRNEILNEKKLQSNLASYEEENQDGNKKIIHKVKRGETLNSIAKKYNVSESKIRNWNGLKYGKKIKVGKRLKIFVSKNLSNVVTSEKNGTQKKHIVKKGETLSSIAKKYNIKVENIKSWNNISSNKIKVDQSLKLYVSTTNIDKKQRFSSDNKTEQKQIVHKVKRGDTLCSIAKKYGTTSETLQNLNNLGNTELKIGMKLNVSLDE